MPDFTDLDERIALKKALREALQERDAAREETLEMVRERNEARAQLRWEQGVNRQVTRHRDEVQEAAEEYWEAWQESASFCEILAELNEEWRKKVERLESKLDTSRVANRLRQRRLDAAVAERDRLREALEEYGTHRACCAKVRGLGVPDCDCGLASALKGTEA